MSRRGSTRSPRWPICRDAIEWHLIGPLQSNKTRAVAEAFDWVDSLDRLKIAQRLSEQRPAHLPPLQVCLQVNISGETSKSGVAPAEVGALAQAVAALPRLCLRGLMAIPAPAATAAQQRAAAPRAARADGGHHPRPGMASGRPSTPCRSA